MVARFSVDGAAHRVANQAAGHRLRLDPRVELELGIEGRLGGAVGDQLDGPQQAPAADVADMAVVGEAIDERALQRFAHLAHPGQQAVLADRALDGQRGGAGNRMAHIGMAVLEETAALADGAVDLAADQQRADRLVAGPQTLGHGEQVGGHAFGLAGEQRAGAAHAAHHLIEDQQHAVAIADLADALEVAGNRRHRAHGRADHRLDDESGDGLRPQLDDHRLELARDAQPVGLLALVRGLVAVGVARRDVPDAGDQQGLEGLAAREITAGRERADGIAVIALAPGDQVAALGLADLDKVLAGQLERRFHRLGAAGNEVGVSQITGRRVDQHIGQPFHRLVGEEGAVGEGDGVELVLDRLGDRGMAVPEARHRRPARSIEVALARCVDDIDALALRRARHVAQGQAVKDVGHGVAKEAVRGRHKRC